MANLYRGLSTIGRSKKFRVVDFDLVKQDLINHFNIRRGEKLMQPGYGTIIWDMLFEPLTDATRQAIIDDVKNIAGSDPRISLQNISIQDYDHGLGISIDLIYVPSDQSATLSLQFDNDSMTLTTNSGQ